MKVLIASAFVIITTFLQFIPPTHSMFTAPPTNPTTTSPPSIFEALGIVDPNPKCLLNQCGSSLGFLTNYCNEVCIVGGFISGKCSNVPGQAQCTCKGGNGDAQNLLKENCSILCPPACRSCGYKSGVCHVPVNETAKNAVRCNCSR